MYIEREISRFLQVIASQRPALLLTGARQTGKSTLLKRLFPDANYVTLDRPLDAGVAQENPAAFLKNLRLPCVIDEIQNAPALFVELKILIDADRSRYGQFILTGSQQFQLMKGVTESLAGRIGLFHLESLSTHELSSAGLGIDHDYIWRGGYPELWAHSSLDATLYYRDYVTTYLERDLRQFVEVQSLRDFDRFLRACALRVGNLVNFSEISADAGVTSTTGKRWMDALIAGHLVSLLEPYHSNMRKRLVKTPKLYFHDTGLLCFLLGITDQSSLRQSPLLGRIWENVVFSQLIRDPKVSPRHLFFARDKQKKEVDFLIEAGTNSMLIEAKSGEYPKESELNFDVVCKEIPAFRHARRFVACMMDNRQMLRLDPITYYNPIYFRPSQCTD